MTTPRRRTTSPLPARVRKALAAAAHGHEPEPPAPGPTRRAEIARRSTETRIRCRLTLDGRGRARVDTSIGLLDHMLGALARHGGFDLHLRARGDLHVDQHHTVEDVGLVLGRALREALGDARGIRRAGCFLFPMDEAIGFAAVDLCGRPTLVSHLPLDGALVGELEADVVEDLLLAFAREARAAVHVMVPYGRNDHHRLEAAFKALGRALREACSRDARAAGDVTSTKGLLDT